MKTQIIQLNNNDDTISVGDKMGWCQTGRILLVLPGNGHFLYRKLELNLIKRHANKLGAQVALITKDPEIHFIARQLGIPVFNNQRNALNWHWRAGRRKNIESRPLKSRGELEEIRNSVHPRSDNWMEHPLTRILCFVIGVLALLSMGIFILPGATVSLTPQVVTQSMTLSVLADPTSSTTNLSTGSMPAESREVIVEGSQKMVVTGEIMIPDAVAHGALRFTNISDHKIIIPTRTVVSTLGENPVRFLTSSEYEISIDPGKTAIVSARAFIPGSAGNLPPESVIVIEDDLGLEAIVTNIYAMYGGTDASVPAPTMRDLRSLHETLVDYLEQAARTELESSLTNGDMLIAPSVKLIEIMEKTVTPAVGEPGRELNLSLRLRFQAQIVTDEVMNGLVRPILDANLKKGYTPIDDTIGLTNLTNPTFREDGKAHWTIQVQRKLQAILPTDTAISMIKGLSISQAEAQLEETLPIARPPQIKVTPGWWHRLPFLAIRIQLSIPKS